MKNIIITGSTDGVGKLAALNFAAQGHAVYLHGRNPKKLDATIAEVKAKSNNKNVGGFVADLSDLDAVKQMANEIKTQLNHVDVLVNNAGVFISPVATSKKGYDMRFVVNYLAPYLLTNELLPLIKNTPGARIINLSSAAQSEINYNAMMGKAFANVNATYAQSKLALTMWSFHLAQQLENTVVIAVNPGSLLNTKMANEAYGQHWSPAEKGSDIIFDLALAHDHALHNGEYFDNDSGFYAKAHPHAYNQQAINELIEITKKLIG